jgi:hypothetical protein
MKSIKLYIIAGLLLTTIWCSAQTNVKYTYDPAGNRINRIISLTLSSSSMKVDTSLNNGTENGSLKRQTDTTTLRSQIFEESVGEQKITISPNPTKGLLAVRIQGYEKIATGKTALYVYTLAGKQLIVQTPLSSSFTVDLSGYPNGVYLLRLVLGDKISEWKIIKK